MADETLGAVNAVPTSARWGFAGEPSAATRREWMVGSVPGWLSPDV